MKKIILLIGLLIPIIAFAQPYSINWYKVSGGGGASSNGQYVLSGTIGQHDAGGPMTGGTYSLTGGFWALFAVATPGAPSLTITYSGGSAIVSWPATATGFLLQTNSSLATTNWVNDTSPVTTSSGTNSVTVTPPVNHLFFRLVNP
jgi:hypothetical protein